MKNDLDKIDETYEILLREYKKVINLYDRGLITKKECSDKTEILEDKMI